MNILSAILRGIGKFWKSGLIAKIIMIIAVLVVFGGIKGCVSDIGEGMDKSKQHKHTYVWSDSTLASMLPQPTNDKGEIKYDSEDTYEIEIYDSNEEEFNAYVSACKEKGFTVDYNSERSDSIIEYTAKNKKGYKLSVSYYIEEGYYDTDSLVIELKKPEKKVKQETKPQKQETSKQETKTEETSTGIRSDVKEAMDAYEAFMNDYCDFMETYSESDDISAMMADYMDYMSKYADFEQKWADMEEDLTDEELIYYLDINTRIQKRLLSIDIQE